MSAAELLLNALDELRNEDLKRFHFFLNLKNVEGCDRVPRTRLENQSRDGTVAVMVDFYGEESAVAVTDVILQKMGFNNIRCNLLRAYQEQRSSTPSSPPPASPSPASSASTSSAPVTMSAHQGSVIIAPTLTGGSIGTLTISIPKP